MVVQSQQYNFYYLFIQFNWDQAFYTKKQKHIFLWLETNQQWWPETIGLSHQHGQSHGLQARAVPCGRCDVDVRSDLNNV